MTRPFRFGAVAPVLTDVPTWLDQVRRLADLGFSTVLVPDFPQLQPAPGPTLATAAAVADIRVGTWVYAAPLRPAWSTAWEAHSLTVLTDGRFEMGIGAGRPGIEHELRDRGMPVLSASQRLAVVREAVAELRRLDADGVRTPVTMAVRGPRARALALEVADTVTIATVGSDTREEVADLARGLLVDRDVELALHVPIVGDEIAPFMASAREVDPVVLREVDSLAVLPTDPAAAVDELERRREEIGFSYVVVGAASASVLAPAVARLAGS